MLSDNELSSHTAVRAVGVAVVHSLDTPKIQVGVMSDTHNFGLPCDL